MTFQDYLKSESLRPQTAQLYTICIELASEYDSILTVLEDQTLTATRRDTYKKAIKHWAKYTDNKELLDQVTVTKVGGSRKRLKKPEALNLKIEWPALLEEIRKLPPIEEAIFELIATTGLRISEVLDMKTPTFLEVLEKGFADTKQKGGENRIFSLVTEHQKDAAKTLSGALGGAGSVWCLLKCPQRKVRGSVEDWIRRKFKKLGRDAGIKKRITPHICRKTVGDAVRSTSGDMKLVQEILGHKSLKTTLEWYQDHKHPEEAAAALKKALEG